MQLKSQWESSQAAECRRGLMCGMGYSEEEQKRPRIAVVNSWNEYNPGHVHLKQLAERVKAGIRDAGGKSRGSKNRLNVVKATLNALSKLRSAEEIAATRA